LNSLIAAIALWGLDDALPLLLCARRKPHQRIHRRRQDLRPGRNSAHDLFHASSANNARISGMAAGFDLSMAGCPGRI